MEIKGHWATGQVGCTSEWASLCACLCHGHCDPSCFTPKLLYSSHGLHCFFFQHIAYTQRTSSSHLLCKCGFSAALHTTARMLPIHHFHPEGAFTQFSLLSFCLSRAEQCIVFSYFKHGLYFSSETPTLLTYLVSCLVFFFFFSLKV